MTTFAYTEQNYRTYPGYVNLREEDGVPLLTVRSKENNGNRVADIVMPREELLALADAIYARYAQPAAVIPDHMG